MVFLLSLAVVAAAMLAMALGVMISGRCLRGSCGGPDVTDSDGLSLRCATCPRREDPAPHTLSVEARR